MKDVRGAAAFVTGGASGIGLGIARSLSARGARVAIADVRENFLSEASRANPELLPIQLDITDREGFAGALDHAEEALGPLRILVNNAGVGIVGPVDDAGFDDWDWGVSVNITGVANGVVLGLPRIKAHGLGGHVVNTASLAALLPARRTRGIYAATKAAVVALTEHLQAELQGSGIGVTVVCPGPVVTHIAESGRLRPANLRQGSRFQDFEKPTGEALKELEAASLANSVPWLDADSVGEMTAEAILGDRLYVVTHPGLLPAVRERHAAIEAAMGG